MREFEIKPELKKKLVRLFKKDGRTYQQVMNKIEEVIGSHDIDHYKNLRYDMKDSKGVHIGHFVLLFSYDPSKNFVSFEDLDHHDKIYR